MEILVFFKNVNTADLIPIAFNMNLPPTTERILFFAASNNALEFLFNKIYLLC